MLKVEADVTAKDDASARAAFSATLPEATIISCELNGGTPGAYLFKVGARLPGKGLALEPFTDADRRGCRAGLLLFAVFFAFMSANCAGLWWTLHEFAKQP